VKLPESKVFHIRGFGIGGDVGLSPLAFARQTLGSALATEEAAARVFANGMRPQGFFTVEKVLTQEQRAQAKSVLIDPYQGSQNAGKSGILEAGFKWQDVQMPAEDAQLLQSRQFSVEEVCRWLGIPPILVGHASAGQTMWGSGVEQIMLGWLTLGLRPYLARIEQSIKRSLLAPSERKVLYPEFTVEGLLRADSAGRANLYSTFAQNGIMTRNEIRALENLPSEEGGDVLTVQVNLQNISNLAEGASPQPKPQPAEEDGNVTPFPNRRSGGGRN
jgi:HK97 family phage portal protein